MKREEYGIVSIGEKYPKIGRRTVATFYATVVIAGEKREICATGESRCCPRDKYNKNFGMLLACARANKKLGRKLEKLLLRDSYKPKKFVDEKPLTEKQKKLIEDIVKRMAKTEAARYINYLVRMEKKK